MTMLESPFRPPVGVRLREAHAHVAQFGLASQMIQLDDCISAEDMLARIAEASPRERSGRTALLAGGARPESWESTGWPSLAQIDAVTRNTPFCGWCFDYHALMTNSAGLALAGIAEDSPDPPGGIIGRSEDQCLNGLVYEQTAIEVWNAVLGPSGLRSRSDVFDATRLFERAGFREIHDMKAQTWLGPMLADISRQHPDGALGARYVLWPLVEDLAEVVESRGMWECDAVRLGGGKIFVDGTLNSRTAWMLHDYADAQTKGQPGKPRGVAMMSPREIEDAVRQCDAAGVPMAAHAIGDAAVRAVLDAIEKVRPATPGFRIEHAELVDEADIRRFADLGVICSVQPCHLLYDIEVLRRAVSDRLDRVLPLRSLIDAGCEPGGLMIFGSDAPIVRPDPGDSVQAAVERRRVGMGIDDAIGIDEALTVNESWACFGPGD